LLVFLALTATYVVAQNRVNVDNLSARDALEFDARDELAARDVDVEYMFYNLRRSLEKAHTRALDHATSVRRALNAVDQLSDRQAQTQRYLLDLVASCPEAARNFFRQSCVQSCANEASCIAGCNNQFSTTTSSKSASPTGGQTDQKKP